MTRYRLKSDFSTQFRNDYTVTAKAGSPVRLIKGASGTLGDLFVIDATHCDAGNCAAIFKHDSKYFYIWVHADHVEAFE